MLDDDGQVMSHTRHTVGISIFQRSAVYLTLFFRYKVQYTTWRHGVKFISTVSRHLTHIRHVILELAIRLPTRYLFISHVHHGMVRPICHEIHETERRINSTLTWRLCGGCVGRWA